MFTVPISKLRKLRLGEFKKPSQGHAEGKRKREADPGLCDASILAPFSAARGPEGAGSAFPPEASIINTRPREKKRNKQSP